MKLTAFKFELSRDSNTRSHSSDWKCSWPYLSSYVISIWLDIIMMSEKCEAAFQLYVLLPFGKKYIYKKTSVPYSLGPFRPPFTQTVDLIGVLQPKI